MKKKKKSRTDAKVTKITKEESREINKRSRISPHPGFITFQFKLFNTKRS